MPIVVVIGPSGAGKTSLIDRFVADHPNSQLHKSATTRPQRDSNDTAHNFMSESQFGLAVKSNQFIHPVEVYGHHYALPHLPDSSSDQVLFVLIRQQFVKPFKALYPHATVIQVEASLDTLTSRLASRNDAARDNPQQIQQEIELGRGLADYIISNDNDINTSYRELTNICNHL